MAHPGKCLSVDGNVLGIDEDEIESDRGYRVRPPWRIRNDQRSKNAPIGMERAAEFNCGHGSYADRPHSSPQATKGGLNGIGMPNAIRTGYGRRGNYHEDDDSMLYNPY